MRYILIFLQGIILIFGLGCHAQSNQSIIVENQSVDIIQYPIYHDLKAKSAAYNYLDSIEINELTYLSDGLKVKAYVIQPKAEGKYPCIIFNRGGNRDFGAWNASGIIRFFSSIAKEGYVVIASQYRGNAGGEGTEEFGGADLNDVIVLPNVLAELEKADTSKIGMYGWSRGGMMTYMAMAKMNNIKAVVVGGGVTDHIELIKDRPEMEATVYAELIPNYEENKEQELKKRSAIYWVDQFSKTTPVLLMHGGSDWRVKPNQSLTLALEFERYRIPYRLIVYEGDDHGISKHKKESNTEAMAWFARFLKAGEQLPKTEFQGK